VNTQGYKEEIKAKESAKSRTPEIF